LVKFLSATLPFIDLYLFWLIGLTIVGLKALPGLSLPKIWASVLIAVVFLLALEALPGFLGGSFSGMSVTQPFLF
jgi:ABC-type transporter Mla maintaining outer membrane lipid asymmetry permease subunit MlaE